MTRTIGRLLMVIAVGHTAVGVALFHAPLAAMLRDGLFNSIEAGVVRDGIDTHVGRALAFWFLLFGPALFMLGQIANRAVERSDGHLLRIVGWNLLAIGVIGVIVMPVSGFWTLIAVVPVMLHTARRAQPS